MTAAPPLRLHTKLLYGLGSTAYGVKDVAFRTFLLLYYNQVLGVPADLVSLAILVALVVDALSDPVVGHLSDNLRSRWGRRHPFIYASALPAAAAFWALFHPPPGLSSAGLFAWILGLSVLVRTLITFYEIPSSSLAPELASDYDERTRLASYRYFFGVLGGYGMAFLTLNLFLTPTPTQPLGQLNPEGYARFALVGAVVMALSILASALATHHRIPWLRQDAGGARARGLRQHLGQVRAAWAHRGFLAILAFGFMKFTMVGLASALALYFGTFFWGLSARQLSILALDGIVAAAVAIVLAPWLSARVGKRNGAVLLSVALVVLGSAPLVLALSGHFLPKGSDALVAALFVIQACAASAGVASMVLVHAMIADVVEEQELKTGRRSEGLFYAAHSFLQKCVSGLGVFLGGLMLGQVGLRQKVDPAAVPPEVPEALALWYLPVFALGTLGAAACLFAYRLDRAGHAANLARLRARAAAAE
ncbi:MAG: MFS transporter [Sphingomonadaceae bacterium]|uniref:MFS transporter n=1 Tax=Thermaurantiacus sp. TaxID=2820283 RepID=UPI00298F36F4|nr:MFS transporter [Thermaurantiacus sp.]MCS6986255.1 MFS transporter [Sphingomonadaceae bacterium]MDW8415702.1 MFS transporter [Thermaurantiacus sp.]